jgi:tetratricopeptide (TPR) repeat protein
MTEWFSEAWEALGQHAGPLEALAVLGAAVWFVIYPARRWWANRQPPPSVTLANPEALRPIASAAPPTGSMHMDLATFEAIQERALDAARKQLAAAHGAERQRLEDKIEALNARLRDPDEALAQQQAIITSLEDQLTRRSNEIGGDDLAAARTALESGDFTKARALFETLAARTAPEVAANADAQFALGQIAEAEIRWHDAHRHYANAARLNPDFSTLKKASDFAERTGDYANAFRFSGDLVDLTRKIGTQEKLSLALNEHAINLRQLGRYAEAEGLYRQAIDIGRATIGEVNADFAPLLNNLAGVVREQGRYAEAERLYRQALDIDRATIGEAHPDFATHLNNLAVVVEAQGRYAEAEGLYRQALDIDRATIGEAHPGFATDLNNLAGVVQAQGRYAEAEGLFAQALSQCRKTLGDGHPNSRTCATNFLGLLTTHLPNSPHLATVQSVLAAGPVSSQSLPKP